MRLTHSQTIGRFWDAAVCDERFSRSHPLADWRAGLLINEKFEFNLSPSGYDYDWLTELRPVTGARKVLPCLAFFSAAKESYHSTLSSGRNTGPVCVFFTTTIFTHTQLPSAALEVLS